MPRYNQYQFLEKRNDDALQPIPVPREAQRCRSYLSVAPIVSLEVIDVRSYLSVPPIVSLEVIDSIVCAGFGL